MHKLHDWTECQLWEILSSRHDETSVDCQTTLRRIMPAIQIVLTSGATSPKDFTLHDAGHSFRVAQRMIEIARGVLETLTSFELSLLILSAYLHDIGMTPEFDKVESIYGFLLDGSYKELDPEDSLRLQTWLDDHDYQIVPPISDSIPLNERLHLAREITTYYCRAQHNSWSREWILKNLSSESLNHYHGWTDDLILLCQSHHFGFEALMQEDFRIRMVGQPSEVVNLRFLALVLRIADILEFDPERTPDIIIRHRSISKDSLVYWWKDAAISSKMQDGKIYISARPDSATIHRAVEEMLDAIDTELALCKRIADHSPLGFLPGKTELLPYEWNLPLAIHRTITPRENSYEYINGAFRPDTKKLLALLSGTSLYHTSLHAVRELVQNSFDAVAERVAYQRLRQPNPSSASLARQLSEMNRVSLQFEIEGSVASLVCVDSGIGMTKAIIQDRVLVSGSGPRHDVRSLERQCKEKGFELGRSGQFGIGILSYFMIATSVEIETLRAQEAGDPETTGWRFTTEGVGSFGELRRQPAGAIPGTKVRLRLNSEISKDPKQWYEALRSYLTSTLVYCPCEFYLSSPLPGCEPLKFEPGWTMRDNTDLAFRPFRQKSQAKDMSQFDLLSSVEKEKHWAVVKKVDELEAEFRACIRWRSEEGVRSDKSAHYTISLPYFEYQSGVSLAFLRPRRDRHGQIVIDRILDGIHYRPNGIAEQAWKGMALERARWGFGSDGLEGAFIRVNWVSDAAGKIMVNRNSFVAEASEGGTWREILTHLQAMERQFLSDFSGSEYSWFNERITNTSPAKDRHFCWLAGEVLEKGDLREEGEVLENGDCPELHWEAIAFPAISRSAFGYSRGITSRSSKYAIGGRLLNVVPWSNPAPKESEFAGAIGWNSTSMPPDRIVSMPDFYFQTAPIWTEGRVAIPDRSWLEAEFPPEWRRLCGILFEWYGGYEKPAHVWNRNNRLLELVTQTAWESSLELFRTSIDPVPYRDQLMTNSALVAAWLMRCISTDSSKIWEGLPERDPELLPRVFELLGKDLDGEEVTPLMFWIEEPGNRRLRVIDASKWEVIKDKRVLDYLSKPADEWAIHQIPMQ